MIDKNAPNETLPKQKLKNKQKLWIKKRIIKSVKTKRIYYKTLLKHNRNSVMVDAVIIETLLTN